MTPRAPPPKSAAWCSAVQPSWFVAPGAAPCNGVLLVRQLIHHQHHHRHHRHPHHQHHHHHRHRHHPPARPPSPPRPRPPGRRPPPPRAARRGAAARRRSGVRGKSSTTDTDSPHQYIKPPCTTVGLTCGRRSMGLPRTAARKAGAPGGPGRIFAPTEAPNTLAKLV